MSKLNTKIETWLEQLGYLLCQNRLKSLAIIVAILVFFIYWVPNLTIDTSFERMLRKDDPALTAYNAFRDQFGYEKYIVITIEAPDIFSPEFLNKLKLLHGDIEKKVPYLQEVNSLINARNTRGKDDTLIVDTLLKGWPEKEIDLTDVKKQAADNPVYVNYLISEDTKVTAVIIETKVTAAVAAESENPFENFEEQDFINDSTSNVQNLSEKEIRKVVKAVEQLVVQYNGPDFLMAFTGIQVIEDVYNKVTLEDMRFVLLIATAGVILFLALLFRRISGVILPFIIVYSTLLTTMGLMAFLNISITQMTTVLPVFLVVVGTADAVHILSFFYRRFQQGSTKEEAIVHALGHSGPAIVMTSITTIAGVLSFAFSELATIGELGIFSASGVGMALFYTIFLLPVLLALIPIKKKSQTISRQEKQPIMDRVLLSFAHFSTTHPRKILFAGLIIFSISAIFLFKLEFFLNVQKYLPDSMAVKQDLIFIDKALKGTRTLEIVIDTKKQGGIYSPDILNRIEKISRSIEKINYTDVSVGKVFSINDIIKENNQALHGNDPEYYTIPQDRKAIAQELFLFESSGSKALERIVDNEFSKTRISIKVPWLELFVSKRFIADIKKQFQDEFRGIADIAVTGGMAVMAKTVPMAIYSMGKSYILAFLVIAVMMILLVGDLKLGLLSMIPNLMPILIVMGFMGLAGIPLDLTSLMIGSIAIGLVVDDTMHFMYHYRRYYRMSEDKKIAIQETLLNAGRAMLITTLILCSGFFAGIFATLKNLITFGICLGAIVIIALLADFILAPALMMVVKHRR